jgi:hypothetical protein
MTREEKIKLAIEKGFTYDEMTGKIYGVRGNEITCKLNGYINLFICLDNKKYNLKGHQLAYYIKYGKIVDCIDHRDGNRANNKIDNLREVTKQQNNQNRTKAKGYYHFKRDNNFKAQIKVDNKTIHIGYFNTEQEARQAYLDAKKKYHI